MPAAGHMVHMPAHIDLRVGRYADAAEANVRAIAADEDYLAQCQAQGLYPVSYYPHNLHFLWAAATFEGRSTVAVDAARQVAAKVPHHHAGALAWTADFPVTPWLAYARFGRWREMLTEPKPPEHRAVCDGHLALRTRLGLCRARRGQACRGRAGRAHDAVGSRRLSDHAQGPAAADQLANRERASCEANWPRGRDATTRRCDSSREATALEDGIPYNEPPVWHQPPRQVLGALLLARRPASRGGGRVPQGPRAVPRERLVAVRTVAKRQRAEAGRRCPAGPRTV